MEIQGNHGQGTGGPASVNNATSRMRVRDQQQQQVDQELGSRAENRRDEVSQSRQNRAEETRRQRDTEEVRSERTRETETRRRETENPAAAPQENRSGNEPEGPANSINVVG
ncbi:MAG: hypothetical protein ACLFQK_04760 [Fibrobacterota bacterium]